MPASSQQESITSARAFEFLTRHDLVDELSLLPSDQGFKICVGLVRVCSTLNVFC